MPAAKHPAAPALAPARECLRSSALRAPEAEATARRLRRFKATRKALLADRGDDPTRAQEILADNASGLAMWAEEQIEMLIAGDESVDIGKLQTVVNTLRRLLETLGLDRVMRDVSPTLSKYLEAKNGHA